MFLLQLKCGFSFSSRALGVWPHLPRNKIKVSNVKHNLIGVSIYIKKLTATKTYTKTVPFQEIQCKL